MSKKKILSLALVAILVAIMSFGTLAWFNASYSVTNRFHVATSDDSSDSDDIFSVNVWEKNDLEGGGTEFKDILPGDTIRKEPIVENTGAYPQYIRMTVTLTDAAVWIAALGNEYDLSTIFLGHDETLWTRGSADLVEDNLVYAYYLNEILDPDEEVSLFTHVQIPASLTQEQMAQLDGSFDLKVRADAIQSENLGEGVDSAQKAFAAVQWGVYDDGPKA